MFKKFENIDEPNAEQTAEFKRTVSAVCSQILEIWDIKTANARPFNAVKFK